MTRRKASRHGGRGQKQNASGVEWVGGIASMPGYVTGEGHPYRPEMLVWMGAEGAVLGSRVGRPGDLIPIAGESLQNAIERPMWGPPHLPARVRVASPELAEALRAARPAIDIVCAPTPEIDAMLALMRDHVAEEGLAERSYLSPETGADAVASFFSAAAALFRVAPWKVVPDDECLFSITIEELDVRDLAVSVIGQMGKNFGFVMFSGLEDFDAYLAAAVTIELGEKPEMPPHFALNFDPGSALAPELRKEIAQHRWEVAGPNAYPWLVAIDEDLVGRPPTAEEMAIAEAVARALAGALAEKEALLAAWDDGKSWSRTLSVRIHPGKVEVILRTPYEDEAIAVDPSRDVLADLAALAEDGDVVDADEREPLEGELVCRFAAAPESQGLDEIGACRFVMDFAANYFGATIATLDPVDLREILFEIVPRKVSIDASAASEVIEEMRALYGFLKREYGLAQADACLRVLDDDAVEMLEAGLSDSRNFGLAKSLCMAGREEGFDVDSRAGLEEWLQSAQGMHMPTSADSSLPAPPGAAKGAGRAKKNKRKAARKSRKRNR